MSPFIESILIDGARELFINEPHEDLEDINMNCKYFIAFMAGVLEENNPNLAWQLRILCGLERENTYLVRVDK